MRGRERSCRPWQDGTGAVHSGVVKGAFTASTSGCLKRETPCLRLPSVLCLALTAWDGSWDEKPERLGK
jgi:hypothetical protein